MIHFVIELSFSFALFVGLIYCLSRIAKLEDRIDRHRIAIEDLYNQLRSNARTPPAKNPPSPPPSRSQSPPPMPPPPSPTQETTSPKIESTLQNPTMRPEENNDLPPIPEPAAAAAQYFYMSGPMTNYFPPTAKSMTKENTLYKFTVYGDGQVAFFELHTEGAPLKEIIRAKDSYIKPACNELNFPPSNVRHIATITPGKAALEGDRWLITTKATIRYE